MNKTFKKLRTLVIAGLVAAPMFATTVASHADAPTVSHEVAYRVHDEFMNDSRASKEFKFHVARTFPKLHSDQAILAFEASMKQQLENPTTTFTDKIKAEYYAYHTVSTATLNRDHLISVFTKIENNSNIPESLKWLMSKNLSHLTTDAALDNYYNQTVSHLTDKTFMARVEAQYKAADQK